LSFTFVLPLALHAAPVSQEWPTKGDKVYIAATFTEVQTAPLVKGYVAKYNLKPCEELEVLDANPKKARWAAKNPAPVGGTVQLEGAWLLKMHRSQAECASQYSGDGEPNVKRSGGTYKITPPR
jgi:hypothetical protein